MPSRHGRTALEAAQAVANRALDRRLAVAAAGERNLGRNAGHQEASASSTRTSRAPSSHQSVHSPVSTLVWAYGCAPIPATQLSRPTKCITFTPAAPGRAPVAVAMSSELYKVRPTFKDKFPQGEVKKIIGTYLKDFLHDKSCANGLACRALWQCRRPALAAPGNLAGLQDSTLMLNDVPPRHSPRRYSPELTAQWTREIADGIKGSIKQLELQRYKYVVQVVIGEQRGEGVRMGCRCFWDADTDVSADEAYKNVRSPLRARVTGTGPHRPLTSCARCAACGRSRSSALPPCLRPTCIELSELSELRLLGTRGGRGARPVVPHSRSRWFR